MTVNSFGGERYFPPSGAGQVAIDQPGALPARPVVEVQKAVVVAGQLRCTFTPAPGKAWLVRRVTVQNTVFGQAFVYVGDKQPQNIVSGTRTGTFDENDTSQPIFVPEGSPVLIVWTGATTGSAWGRIEYVEV